MSGLSNIVGWIMQVRSDRYDLLFTLSLLVGVGAFLALTPQYSEDGQLFPLVIGIPTFVLLLGLVIILASPRAKKLAEGFAASDLFDMGDVDDPETNIEQSTDLVEQRQRVIVISTWVIILSAMIWVIGFLAGTLVFMIAFYRLQAEQDIRHTLLYSLLTWIVIVVVFVFALNVPFYPGLLDITIPLID